MGPWREREKERERERESERETRYNMNTCNGASMYDIG